MIAIIAATGPGHGRSPRRPRMRRAAAGSVGVTMKPRHDQIRSRAFRTSTSPGRPAADAAS